PDGTNPHPIDTESIGDPVICTQVQLLDPLAPAFADLLDTPTFYAHIFTSDVDLSTVAGDPDPTYKVDPGNVAPLPNNTYRLDTIPNAQTDTAQILSVWVADSPTSTDYSNTFNIFLGDDGDNSETSCDCGGDVNNNGTTKGKRHVRKARNKFHRKHPRR